MAAQVRRFGLKPVARQLHQPPRRHQRAGPLRIDPDAMDVAHTMKRELEALARRVGRTFARALQVRDPLPLGNVEQPVQRHAFRLRRDGRERLPQPPVAVRPGTCHEPRERRHARQQHAALAGLGLATEQK